MILWGVILIIVAFVAVLLIIRPFVNKQNDKKMKNKSVEDYLKYYLSLESPQYAVMIKGPWGCGKTFFVKNFLDKNNDEETRDDTVINLKPIYISLNGMRTLENLQEAIRAELNPLLYSKTARIGKAVLKGLLKTTLRIDLDFDEDGRTDGALSGNLDSSAILTLVGGDVKGTKALFLDDLERSDIGLEELFGFLNNFVEHYSCKVILIADENKLIEKCEYYLKIKEKLIGPAFDIVLDVEVLFNNFLAEAASENTNYNDIKKHIEDNKDQIIKIYIASQCANLRIFRRCIADFLHFSSLFHFQLKNNNATYYELFMNYIIIIFFIAYIELKTGNKDGVKYNLGLFIDEYLDQNKDDEKNPVQETNNKYKSILEEFGLDSLSSYKEIEIINEYLNNQALDGSYIVKELSSYQLFISPRKIEDWVKLKRYEYLEDSEFTRIYNKELERLKNTEMSNFDEFLTFVSHVFYFNENGIVKEDIDKIIKYADAQIDQILMQIDSFKRIKNRLKSCMHTPGLSQSFIEFLERSVSKLEECELKEIGKYIQEKFLALNEGDTTFLKLINETSERYSNPLGDQPYLCCLDPLTFSSNILKLNNESLREIYEYLLDRYNKNNYSVMHYQKEYSFIVKVKDLLNYQEFDGLQGWWIRRIKDLLDIAIVKMQTKTLSDK